MHLRNTQAPPVSKMKKLLVICGPTASGKTSLALHLAKVHKGELLSADSRQVYVGMDIGTGKDKPIGVPIWGYDITSPTEEFSVSQYLEAANSFVKNIWKRKKLPIVVGGTGLYIKGLTDGIPTSQVPPNKILRAELENKSAKELFELLKIKNPGRAGSMNDSDKKNPRRLVRAIEVSEQIPNSKLQITNTQIIPEDFLFVGLFAPKEVLNQRIQKRVEDRIAQGLLKEIKNLLDSGVNWDMQSMNTLGYKEWRDFFEGKVTKEQVIKRWMLDEIQYAKRQITWFKKDKRINWFDITKKTWKSEVEILVRKWNN